VEHIDFLNLEIHQKIVQMSHLKQKQKVQQLKQEENFSSLIIQKFLCDIWFQVIQLHSSIALLVQRIIEEL